MSLKDPLKRLWNRARTSSRSIVVVYLVGLVVVVAMVVVLGSVTDDNFNDVVTEPSADSPSAKPSTADDGDLEPDEAATGVHLLCGRDFRQLAVEPVVSNDQRLLGEVYLMRDPRGYKCVAAIRHGDPADEVDMSAFIETDDGDRVEEEGRHRKSAGPVTVAAKDACVSWGGLIEDMALVGKTGYCE